MLSIHKSHRHKKWKAGTQLFQKAVVKAKICLHQTTDEEKRSGVCFLSQGSFSWPLCTHGFLFNSSTVTSAFWMLFCCYFFRKPPLSHTWSSQTQLSSVSLTIPSSAPTTQPPPKPSWVPGLSASAGLALSRPCSWLQVWTPNMILAERSFTEDDNSSHGPTGGLKLQFHRARGVPTSLGLIHNQNIRHLAHQVIFPTLPCQVKP